jgi:CBS domain-containing protein
MDIAQVLARSAMAEVVVCEADISMREAVSILAQHRIGAMPVMENGEVAGIFSERDVLYCIEAEGEASLAKPVREVMTAPAITASPDTQLEDALDLMPRRRIRHLPVVESGVMCGFVSIGDLVKAQLDEVEYEAESMRVYIQTA